MINKNNVLKLAKNLNIHQNVCIRVIDQISGKVVQEHSGHNSATNSLLFGIAHHLIGDFMPNERYGLNHGYSMLSNYVPRYISLGTMGLINQYQDSSGLPAGIGDSVPSSDDPAYIELKTALDNAKTQLDLAEAELADECPYYPATAACVGCQVCSDRISGKKEARDNAQEAYDAAYQNFMLYNEEARFVEYMQHAPGYSADGYGQNGYDPSKNNGRKYPGLGYAWNSYDVASSYKAESVNNTYDVVTYKGLLYKCISDTPVPAGEFNPECWEQLPDSQQVSKGTTIKMELISQTFPRTDISYRDVVPEYESEKPKTIDVVYSAMITTGALKQFRPEGQDFIFITEAGLWSKKSWTDGGENGLLAAYRIGPPNEKNWDMTIPSNRKILKENILKVGKNQVVQVVWKIQIGNVDEFVTSVEPEPTPSIKYHDNVYYTTGLDSSCSLNKLFLEKLPSNTKNVYFEKSVEKRGCPVPSTIFSSSEKLYFDFVVNDDDSETIYWWTDSGEVNYTTAISQPFYNLNMLSYDMSNWHYIGSTFVYVPDTSVDAFVNVAYAEYGYGMFQVYEGDYGVYYNDPTGTPISTVWDSLDEFKQAADANVITSVVESPLICARPDEVSPYFYYCDKEIGFLDNQNLLDVMGGFVTMPTIGEHSLTSFRNWDTTNLTSLSHGFEYTNNNFDVGGWDTSGVTDTSYMFQGAISNVYGLNDLDLSNVTDASYMFYHAHVNTCDNRGYDDESPDNGQLILDLPKAITVSHMFDSAHLEYYGNEGGETSINLHEVEDCSYMFANAITSGYGYVLGISVTYDGYGYTNCSGLFYNTDMTAIESRLGDYFQVKDIVNRATRTDHMFHLATVTHGGSYSDELDVSEFCDNWDNNNITDMSHMFDSLQCVGTDLNVYLPYDFDTSHVTDMSYMFANEYNDTGYIVNIYLPQREDESTGKYSIGFDFSNVTNLEGMFSGAVCYQDNESYGIYQGCGFSSVRPAADVNCKRMFQGAEGFCNTSYTDGTFDATFHDVGDMVLTGYDLKNYSEMFYAAKTFGFPLDLHLWEGLAHYATDITGMFHSFSAATPQYVDEYGEYQSNYNFDFGMLLSYQIPDKFYIKLPNGMDFSNIEEYSSFAYNCTVPKFIMNNVTVHSIEELNKIKSAFNGNKIYVFEAKNWKFDSSITSLSGFFSGWKRLCAIDLSGWDVSNIQDFSGMFMRDQTEDLHYAGIIDYSSLDSWDISSGVNFDNMCASNLHCLDGEVDMTDVEEPYKVPCGWFNEEPYENGYRFPNWSGTWDTTGLYHDENGYTFSEGIYEPSPLSIPDTTFGTFTPT